MTVPDLDLTDPDLVNDPVTTYAAVREQSPLARMAVPGMGTWWVITRYDEARAMLADPRFAPSARSFLRPPGVPAERLRTMSEMNGGEHLRLRRLVSGAFTPRRAEAFRPRIEAVTARLLDDLGAGVVDLLPSFASPLPMDVICELVGIPAADRPQWREYGAAVSLGMGPAFAAAIPRILQDAERAVAARRAEPGDDLLSDLIRVQDDDGDRLSDGELVTLVWHLVLAGQTPSNLVANAVEELATRPERQEQLRKDPAGLVEELLRTHTPQLMTVPRFAAEDVEIAGHTIVKGDAVTVSIVAANDDPRADTHLAFGYGPHFCLGAAFARVETEVALTALFARLPDLALAEDVRHASDAGTRRPAALKVRL